MSSCTHAPYGSFHAPSPGPAHGPAPPPFLLALDGGDQVGCH